MYSDPHVAASTRRTALESGRTNPDVTSITATQFAVDCKVEQSEIADSMSVLKVDPDGPVLASNKPQEKLNIRNGKELVRFAIQWVESQ